MESDSHMATTDREVTYDKEDWVLLNKMIRKSVYYHYDKVQFNTEDALAKKQIKNLIKGLKHNLNVNYQTWQRIYNTLFKVKLTAVPLLINVPGFIGFLAKWRLEIGK